MGDFNEITRQEEKVGGAIRAHSQMQAFQEVIDECGFMDLGFPIMIDSYMNYIFFKNQKSNRVQITHRCKIGRAHV